MELEQVKKLSDDAVLNGLSLMFENERKISQRILLFLRVIQERRLYAECGYSSLFEMLIKKYKLSETSASQRLKALELLIVVPFVEESLKNGEVNLTTLALAQRQIRREEKLTGEKITLQKKVEIVEQIKNKTQKETEIELMRMLPSTSSTPKTVERRISEDTCRVSINMPDRLKDKLTRLQELWAHVNSSMDYVEIIEKSVDDTLSRIDPIVKNKKKKRGSSIVGFGTKVPLESEPKTHHRSVAQSVDSELSFRSVTQIVDSELPLRSVVHKVDSQLQVSFQSEKIADSLTLGSFNNEKTADALAPGFNNEKIADALAPGFNNEKTADALGPGFNNEKIADALAPGFNNEKTADALAPSFNNEKTADAFPAASSNSEQPSDNKRPTYYSV